MLDQLDKPVAQEDGTGEASPTAVSRWEGQERERAVQRMFTAIARVYDLNNTLLSFGLHHAWKRRAARRIPCPPGGTVLDLGAGTADLALLVSRKLGESGRVLAADLNRAMLREGLRKLRAGGAHRQVTCLQGTAERLSCHDACFDAVVAAFCMRNVGNLPEALNEIHRVLKPGGAFVCLEFSRPVNPMLLKAYDWYSFTLLPWIGTRVAHDHTGVYQYLPASIRTFPDQEGLCQRLREARFGDVSCENLTGGIVAIHIARKNGDEARKPERGVGPRPA